MPPHVLIVDDEVEVCKMLALGLKAHGFQVEYVLSGAQALARVYANAPQAIVLDLMMPDTDGFEVTRYLRANVVTAKIPIIILSAMARPDAEEEALRAGATVFFRKPIGPRDLAAVVRNVLGELHP